MPTGKWGLYGEQRQWKRLITEVQHWRPDSEHRAVVVSGPHRLNWGRQEKSSTEWETQIIDMQLLTVFKKTLLEIVNVCCISPSYVLGSHICRTPCNLHHFYAKACNLCIILALLKCVFKKKKAPQQWVPVYTVYFFQHPQSNLQLIIPVTSLHGKVVYSFS